MQVISNNPDIFSKIKLGKQLGKGQTGTVFLATDTIGNKYAYKSEKILPKDVKHSLKSKVWREVDFALNVANKHPDQFMTLYGWKIDDTCIDIKYDFTDKFYKLEDLPKSQQKYIKNINASPYCSIKLWSLIDGTLYDLVEPKLKLSDRVFYDILLQILNIICIMQYSGYQHNDFHPGNIGYIKTTKPTINIQGHTIPTHGYIFKAIDFGLVLHKKYDMTKQEQLLYNTEPDLLEILKLLLVKNKPGTIGGKEWNWISYWHINEHIPAELLPKLAKYMPVYNNNQVMLPAQYDYFMNKLFIILAYEQFQRQVLNDATIIGVAPCYTIPETHVLYMIKCIYNPKHVLRYFLKTRHLLF
jgi:serine/threonine protein kinase